MKTVAVWVLTRLLVKPKVPVVGFCSLLGAVSAVHLACLRVWGLVPHWALLLALLEPAALGWVLSVWLAPVAAAAGS